MVHDADGATALMSIRPVFASMILSGTKHVELRTTRFTRPLTHVVIYSTMPVGALVGVGDVGQVVVASPASLWRRYGPVTGIERAAFSRYYHGCEQAVAICLARVRRFRTPLPLSAIGERRAPQSFRYLDDVDLRRLLQAGRAVTVRRPVTR